ncbi:MAG: aldo/keto reductase [Clostridiaceae bacterium]|nr:aldo/keto reductase [Clostridiaceae bacterium]
MEQRVLGRSGIKVSPMGLGCWAIGGQFYMDGKIDGYGQTDDKESIKAIHAALDLGVNFLDTSDAYGVGHSEAVIGEALEGRRNQAVIATKFGYLGNEATKTLCGYNLEPDYVERACDASLRRLRTDYIDLYQLHVWEVGISELDSVMDTLDRLVEIGKIRTYGWSTDLLSGIKLIAQNDNCSAIQQEFSIIKGDERIIGFCEDNNLASINRSPLAMGLLTGKFGKDTRVSNNDVRGSGYSWAKHIFVDGKPNEDAYRKLEAVRDIFTSEGRTLAQGALAWIWGKSNVTIPIPGFKSVKQVEENIRAMEFGPLTAKQMQELEDL